MVDRASGMTLSEIGTKYGISAVRVYAILNRQDTRDYAAEQNWQMDLSRASMSLLRAIIVVGLQRVYNKRPGEPKSLPDMTHDDIRARARELGLLRW
jgi:hypothetical protein